jgi:hypothetical protein
MKVMFCSRLQLLKRVFEMLRKVNLLKPTLVIVVKDQGLVDHPELLEETRHLNQDDDCVLLDVLHQIFQEYGRLASLTLKLKKKRYQ